MSVGTRAAVNHMSSEDLTAAGSQIILGGNTYHMLCAPGMEVIQSIGGMHKFMNWNKPMLTDSGGFQVYSLSQNGEICKIDDNGAHFKHPDSGKIIHLTPKHHSSSKNYRCRYYYGIRSMYSGIVGKEAELGHVKTNPSLVKAVIKDYHQKNPNSLMVINQALFGIIQGGVFAIYVEKCAEFVVKWNLEGIAIGGEIIGFDMKTTVEVIVG